jgi:hypothetical protein
MAWAPLKEMKNGGEPRRRDLSMALQATKGNEDGAAGAYQSVFRGRVRRGPKRIVGGQCLCDILNAHKPGLSKNEVQ